jgi:hypothetical protein
MADGTWDNGGAPLQKKGMPLWGKVTLGCCGGCALVFVLLMATCVGGISWVSKHGVPDSLDKVVGSTFLDKTWAEMDRAVRGLKTIEGAKELYRTCPGLAENYPTEEDFLKAAEEWRPNLGEFPAQRPKLRDLIQEKKGGGHFSINTQNSTTRIEYQIPNGGRLFLKLEADRLVDLRVE